MRQHKHIPSPFSKKSQRFKWEDVLELKSPFFRPHKCKSKGERVQLNIRIPKDMRDHLDQTRGTTPIGDYLITIIKNHFNSNS